MIVIFIVKESAADSFFIILLHINQWLESSCVYGSLITPIPLFIQHLNICIKVFKAKCGDKVYMWVLVFFWKMCVSNTNAATAHARAN